MLKESETSNSSTQLVFKCSETRLPPVIRRVLIERKGWREWDKDTDDESVWSLHWKSGRFKLSDWDKCLPHPRLNHCPKSSNITKKDNLYHNLKRLVGSYGKIFDFIPTTFCLSNEYLAFMKAFTEHQETEEEGEKYWICKPSDSSRVRGIFIISHISQLVYDQQYVPHEYISRSLFVGGFKFDVSTTSMHTSPTRLSTSTLPPSTVTRKQLVRGASGPSGSSESISNTKTSMTQESGGGETTS